MNLNETIDNVLSDGSSIEAVDFLAWSTNVLKSCETNKLRVLQAELDEKACSPLASLCCLEALPVSSA